MKWPGGWAGIKHTPGHCWGLDRRIREIARLSFKYRNSHWGAKQFPWKDQTGSQGSHGCGGRDSRRGSASTLHHICTQCLEGTAPVWPCSPHRLQWLSTEPSIAFQGRQMDKVLGTDAKPVYCVYYAAASGVMYLNPSASRQGNAPHAMLLVDSDPFNSLFKIQQLLPCHGKKPWCAPKSHRAWPSAGVRPCLPQLAHPAEGIASFLGEHRQGHTPTRGSTLNMEPFKWIIPEFPWRAWIWI